MHRSTPEQVVVGLMYSCLFTIGCAGDPSPTGPRLELAVAPLELAGVADACYGIAVHNVGAGAIAPSALVWSRAGLCASRYGDGEGGLTFVGTCDASPDGRIHTVSLTLEGLCSVSGCDVSDAEDPGRVDPDTWQNPCPASAPCRLERPCRENADTLVAFDLTVVRDAVQGFFDIAVNFEDIFCSAKLDCVPELLHRPGGPRDLTAVLAFACTSGADTCLYADAVTLTCTNGSWTIDPSAGPGTVAEDSPLLYAAAVYRGDEAFTAFEKQYWNVALGLDETALSAAGDCTLTWGATASEGYWPDQTIPDVSAYPMVTWSRQIVDDGVLRCGSHRLNEVLANEPEASVRTEYVRDTTRAFAASNCAPEGPGPSTCDCAEGFLPNVNQTVCVRELTQEPTLAGQPLDVCAGFSETWVNYSYLGARFTTDPTPSTFEFTPSATSCTDTNTCLQVTAAPWVNRLAAVGVWACPAPDHQQFQDTPYNQWLGFSRCIDIPAAGDFLVGIAGDNQVLLRIDGNTIYQSQSSEAFRAWNVLKVSLSAGTHTVELFGLNLDAVASFGAEISGPFPAGSLNTPAQMAAADYVGNIIFSTASLRGGGSTFQVTTGATGASGLTCPGGFSLDLCDTPSVCVDRDESPCNPR